MKAKFSLIAGLCVLIPSVGLAQATFQGTWGTDGHWVGSPITYQFVASPGGDDPHPSRNWTDAEKAVVKEAFQEWDTLLCDICFSEGTSPNITLRWEDSSFFGGALGAGSENFIAWAYVPGTDFGLSADYPKNEIYFNSAVTWYVDPNPKTDEAFTGWDLLTVAKHEIGHMLGLTHQYQDYFDSTGYTPGVMDDRATNAGGWGAGDRRHPTDADWNALKSLGYAIHPVPEPETYAMLLAGLGVLANVVRRMKQTTGNSTVANLLVSGNGQTTGI